MNNTTRKYTNIAIISAIYTAISLALAPISFGNIQVRLAEVLTMLPLIYPPAYLGVSLGCFITNLIGVFMGFNVLGFVDVVVGTLATFIACKITYKFRSVKIFKLPLISILAPVIVNGIFIGIELAYVLMPTNIVLGSFIFGLEVMVGELISVIIGYILVKKMKNKIFN